MAVAKLPTSAEIGKTTATSDAHKAGLDALMQGALQKAQFGDFAGAMHDISKMAALLGIAETGQQTLARPPVGHPWVRRDRASSMQKEPSTVKRIDGTIQFQDYVNCFAEHKGKSLVGFEYRPAYYGIGTDPAIRKELEKARADRYEVSVEVRNMQIVSVNPAPPPEGSYKPHQRGGAG